ncbi:DMT family transporter [Sandaracinobacteroides saxicola]|uniref:DMT family transporter n=1 Tax=Sandaracinobacteroides saxicola TaxID=2759707 RepID=A0A7G5IFR2_9SPHN|nr:DMT family transporter [Sandaracinobacteroides saxicola]QMW22204.1 DMT family transporter [Sandaracinobacteroides saxicola]
MMNGPSLERRAFAALLCGSALLAFGPLLVRLADVSPSASAFWRMALATPVLLWLFLLARAWGWGLARAEGGGLAPRALLGLGVAAGAFFAADLAAWHAGIVRTTTANATLFANSTAFILAGWAIVVQRRRPSATTLRALLLALAGTLLLLGLSARVAPQNLLGDALSLLAALFYTGYLLVVARLRGGVSPLGSVALVTLAGALWLAPVAAIDPGAFWPGDWTPLIGLALSSQVAGQGLMVFATGRLSATTVGIGLLVQPIISTAAGWLAFGETLSAAELAGAAMIAAALVLIRRPETST